METEKIPVDSKDSYPLYVCLWNYFNNSDYEQTRQQQQFSLQVSWQQPWLKKWAEAFNRAKITDGITEMPFNGQSGWLRNFKNWVMHIRDYRHSDPDVLFADKDYKHRIGDVSTEAAMQLFNRKRKVNDDQILNEILQELKKINLRLDQIAPPNPK